MEHESGNAAGEHTEQVESQGTETVETVATIMVEVRDTAGAGASRGEVEEMLRERLKRAGVELPESEIAGLMEQLVEGDEPAEG
ncbi:hypothetical protein [Leucobacter sp. USHLN153]|uniref:hypothetical protein n=1 Tax=Leucobacter sp. USHLN153 TaxID=3081268 RepID=UPI003017F267